MKSNLLVGLTVLAAGSLFAADPNPKDDITKAAKALGEKPNYSWRTTVVVPDDAPFKPGPTDGKAEKDGFTFVSISFGENTLQAFVKGVKGAAKDQSGTWKSIEEYDKEEWPARFAAAIMRNLRPPVKEAGELASHSKEFKKEGDIYSSDLTEEGAKAMQAFRPGGGGEGPSVSEAKGSVKFWLKDGALTKYEFKLKGKINFNGNEFPNERTTTVEIKDVGTTKLEVPEDAKKKITG